MKNRYEIEHTTRFDYTAPITADPAHPFYNNAVAADLGVSSTYRVADLNHDAATNLKPWAIEQMRKAKINVVGLIGCVGIPFDTPRLLMPVAGRVMSLLKGGACPGNGGKLLTDVPGSLKFGGGRDQGLTS